MLHNLKVAARLLRKTPFVTTVAVLSLALGIGANAAIFSLFDQILLKPLPVPNPQALINLGAPGPKPGSTSCNQAGDCDVVFSYPMYRDLERQQTVLTGLAAHVAFGASLAVNNEPAAGQGMLVSGSYFPTLQLQPALGRLLQPADDSLIGAHYVTVLAHEYWRDRFGADPQAVGRTLIINGHTFTIVGVAPASFTGTTLGARPQVFVPISMRAVVQPGFRASRFERRQDYWVYVFGRRRPEVSLEQATVALNGLYRPIINDVEAPLQEGMSDQTLQRFREKVLTVETGPQGQSSVHAEASTPLWMLFGVTGVVLLIACANIANLLLARGAGRAAEMGVRLALGATRRQLLSLLLTESVLLALLGGLASLVVAQWTLTFIGSLMPSDVIDTLRFELQPSVVLFAAGLSLATGVLFGLFPALHSTRDDLIGVIRAGAGQLTGGRAATRFRAALVTVQITLSTALLVSAGLFLKSLLNVSRVELGMDVAPFATFSLAPSRAGYDTTRAGVYFARIEEELRSLPGVTAVTSSWVPLLSGSNWGTDVRVQGFEDGPDVDDNSRLNVVGAGYFTTLGVSLLRGRDFDVSDILGAQQVAIVNETFARKFNLGDDVVGSFMGQGDSLDTQIIGLIPDIKYSDVKDTVPPVFYTPWRQATRHGEMYFYVKGSLPPEQLLGAIRDVVTRVDPTVPVEDLKTMPQQIRENVFLDRMISILSASFAVLATLLAAVGLYGVLAYSVTQRTREIGVRMALGADGRAVQGLVMREVLGMTAAGAVLGVGAAFVLGRAARSLLYGLQPHDPLVFAASVAVLVLVAFIAGWLPARRAALVDPMQALRYD